MLASLVLLATLGDKCPQYQSCADCLHPKDPALNCGWCSPDAAVNADGTKATQCMDHTSKGWSCFHLYMHDGCIAGYVCNHTCELRRCPSRASNRCARTFADSVRRASVRVQ